jgi:polyisoprenyl-phosphate glycosyltransferase
MQATERPRKTLTVVVPCFNEEEAIPETTRRLSELLEDMASAGMISADSHLLFVDDGSTDRSWALLEDLHLRSMRVRGLRLSRNRGHQQALLAGLLGASGDIVISIDADLQDDPDVMKKMVLANAEGADIVFGVRESRAQDTPFKRITAQSFYRLLRWMGVEIVYNHADYRLMSRRAVEALRTYPETNLFLRGIVMQLGFRTVVVTYARAARITGKSKYSLGKMLGLALEGVTAFSTMPLRYITLLGGLVALFSCMLSLWAFSAAFFFGNTVPGWASTVVPIFLISGVQMMCLGVIGEYIGKIYIETKRRPPYIIEDSLPERRAAAPGEMRNPDRCEGQHAVYRPSGTNREGRQSADIGSGA